MVGKKQVFVLTRFSSDAFIEFQHSDHEKQIERFANYLRMLIEQQPAQSTRNLILSEAAKALGHLARVGGTLTANFVDAEVRKALDWLVGDRIEHKRLAACLVLGRLAVEAPSMFTPQLSSFLDHIWVPIRDPKQHIREAAACSLHSVLELISKRAWKWRLSWYFKIYSEAMKGFKSPSPEIIHGHLLVLGTLVKCSGQFMLARFKESCETILSYKDNKSETVRSEVISLLPVMASYCPEAFSIAFLTPTLTHIINAMQLGQHKQIGFLSLGNLALVSALFFLVLRAIGCSLKHHAQSASNPGTH